MKSFMKTKNIYAVCKNPQYEDFYRKKNSTIWHTSKIDAIGEVNISFDKKRYITCLKIIRIT